MKAGIRGRLTSAAATLAIATVAVASAVSPAAGDEKRGGCDISGKERDLGASYVTSVKARNMSCGKALKLVKAYHECRKDNGGNNGHCDGVKGYSCTRRSASPGRPSTAPRRSARRARRRSCRPTREHAEPPQLSG